MGLKYSAASAVLRFPQQAAATEAENFPAGSVVESPDAGAPPSSAATGAEGAEGPQGDGGVVAGATGSLPGTPPPARLVAGDIVSTARSAAEANARTVVAPAARAQSGNSQVLPAAGGPIPAAAAAAAAAAPASDHGLTFLAVALSVGIIAILARKFMAAMGEGGFGSLSWDAV